MAPQALGADAAGRAGGALRAPTSGFEPLPEGDPVSISLPEYASRAVFDEGRSLQNRTLRILGFIVIGDDGQPYLARMMVSCCAADARPSRLDCSATFQTAFTPTCGCRSRVPTTRRHSPIR